MTNKRFNEIECSRRVNKPNKYRSVNNIIEISQEHSTVVNPSRVSCKALLNENSYFNELLWKIRENKFAGKLLLLYRIRFI